MYGHPLRAWGQMPSDFFCKLATFVPAAGEAAGPPEILRESIGGAAAPPSAGTNATDRLVSAPTFVPAAGEAAGPPEILRECIGGAVAPPSAGTNATDRLRRPHNIIIRYYWESGAFSR